MRNIQVQLSNENKTQIEMRDHLQKPTRSMSKRAPLSSLNTNCYLNKAVVNTLKKIQNTPMKRKDEEYERGKDFKDVENSNNNGEDIRTRYHEVSVQEQRLNTDNLSGNDTSSQIFCCSSDADESDLDEFWTDDMILRLANPVYDSDSDIEAEVKYELDSNGNSGSEVSFYNDGRLESSFNNMVLHDE